MKKVLIISGILVMSLGSSVNSNAITTFFDFEDGKDVAGPLPGIENYLTAKFGSQVRVIPIFDTSTPSVGWWGKEEGLFNKSDILFALSAGGTVDFDPGIYPSELKITQISFTWGVFRPTISNHSFGLDIYDDISNTWINNIFAISNFKIQAGDSGVIIIDSGLKVTAIRFHDDKVRDVGLDNLFIVDNRAPKIIPQNTDVAEASIPLLLSSGPDWPLGIKEKVWEVGMHE